MNEIIHKNLLLIFISIVINLKFCLNASPTSVKKEKYIELIPVDNSEDEFYIKYTAEDNHKDNHEDKEYMNNVFLELSNLHLRNLHLRNLQNYHEMMLNKHKALRVGKRGYSVHDSEFRKNPKWRSFMDAHYGKRSIS